MTNPENAGRLALEAAVAVAAVLPSSEELTPGEAQAGSEHVARLFAGAVVAELTGPISGRLAVLVGEELVTALSSSPMGGLDLAAAVQPALDAAAGVLGCAAGAGRSVDMGIIVDELLGGSGEFTAVPLLGSGIAAAVLVPDVTLDAAVVSTAAGAAGGAVAGAGAGVEAAAGLPTMPQPQLPADTGRAGYDNVLPIGSARRGIEMLHGVEMEVTVELGRTRMPVRDLLALAPGAVIALDRAAGSPADLLVNGRLIARGEVVVVDEDFGLRITEIIDQQAMA